MESKQPLEYKLQVRICRGEKFFGPGVAQLMQLIDQHHSLHKATEEHRKISALRSSTKRWEVQAVAARS